MDPNEFYYNNSNGIGERQRSRSPEEFEADRFIQYFEQKQTQRKQSYSNGHSDGNELSHRPQAAKNKRARKINEAQSTMSANYPRKMNPFGTPINQDKFNHHMQMQQHGKARRSFQPQLPMSHPQHYQFEAINNPTTTTTRRVVTPVAQSVPRQLRSIPTAATPTMEPKMSMSQLITKVIRDKQQNAYDEGGDDSANFDICADDCLDEEDGFSCQSGSDDDNSDFGDVDEFLNSDPLALPPASVYSSQKDSTPSVSQEELPSQSQTQSTTVTTTVTSLPSTQDFNHKTLLSMMTQMSQEMQELKQQLSASNTRNNNLMAKLNKMTEHNETVMTKIDKVVESNKTNNQAVVDYCQGAMEWIKEQFSSTMTNNIQGHMDRIQAQRQAFGFTSGMGNTLAQSINPNVLNQQSSVGSASVNPSTPTNDPYMIQHYAPSPCDMQQNYPGSGEMIETSPPPPNGGFINMMSCGYTPPNEAVFLNNQHHGFLHDVQNCLPTEN